MYFKDASPPPTFPDFLDTLFVHVLANTKKFPAAFTHSEAIEVVTALQEASFEIARCVELPPAELHGLLERVFEKYNVPRTCLDRVALPQATPSGGQG